MNDGFRRDRKAVQDPPAALAEPTGGGGRDADPEESARFKRGQRELSPVARERSLAAQARSESARRREVVAARRDRAAAERDDVARARDQLAAALDAEIEREEANLRSGGARIGIDVLARAAGDRRRAAASRARAAGQRDAAARDRAVAAEDRRLAALDRQAAADELALEGIDHLTGALRRRVGLDAIQRELDRTLRTGESMVVAYVDVDGLKAVNDTRGHVAGDVLLREVVHAIQRHLRSYDVIVRTGGDEFVCALTGLDAAGAQARLEEVSRHLAEALDEATVTVGLAERRREDTLGELVDRADAAMLAARGRDGAPSRGP